VADVDVSYRLGDFEHFPLELASLLVQVGGEWIVVFLPSLCAFVSLFFSCVFLPKISSVCTFSGRRNNEPKKAKRRQKMKTNENTAKNKQGKNAKHAKDKGSISVHLWLFFLVDFASNVHMYIYIYLPIYVALCLPMFLSNYLYHKNPKI
jgi:hypothetical protein